MTLETIPAAAPLTKRLTALTNVAQVVTSGPANLRGYILTNPNAAAAYVKFYDVAAASVIVGTTVPVLTVEVPANDSTIVKANDAQKYFGTAISAAATLLVGDTDATVLAAEMLAQILYR